LGPTGWNNQDTFWSQVPLEDRQIVVVLDSNTMADKAAKSAALGLKSFLDGHRAKVKVIVLPANNDDIRIGVFIYCYSGGSVRNKNNTYAAFYFVFGKLD
jgi:hypothetical protein